MNGGILKTVGFLRLGRQFVAAPTFRPNRATTGGGAASARFKLPLFSPSKSVPWTRPVLSLALPSKPNGPGQQ